MVTYSAARMVMLLPLLAHAGSALAASQGEEHNSAAGFLSQPIKAQQVLVRGGGLIVLPCPLVLQCERQQGFLTQGGQMGTFQLEPVAELLRRRLHVRQQLLLMEPPAANRP